MVNQDLDGHADALTCAAGGARCSWQCRNVFSSVKVGSHTDPAGWNA